ncbi:AMP-binding protein [Pontibacter beigongshangensis]|uniref:AMP-binding protein n=1 Tax=Pontibacter beigongshangensis TaxID=2574733 RepID=UPI00164EF6CF|nr:AMP-binding protein [Pontibacter beigongshangensis]
MTHNFFQNIHEALNRLPEEELIVWPSGEAGTAAVSFTGNDLQKQIAATRHTIENEQVQKGQQVMLAIPVSISLICSLLAVMAAGAVPVLPPAKASKFMLLKLLYHSNVQAILTIGKRSLTFRLLARVLNIKLISLNQAANSITATWLPPTPVSPEQPALISHSSGSTGKPKAIYRSHRILQAQHQVLTQIFPPWPGLRDFPLFPNILLHNLSLGTTSILPDLPWADLTQLNPARIVEQIKKQQIDTITGNLYYFRKLLQYLQQHNIVLSQVKAVGLGGSPITERLAHDLKTVFPLATVYIIYGSSEAEPIAVREVGAVREDPQKGYAVGAVHASLECKIESIGEIVLPGGGAFSVGEIQVRGAHVVASGKDGWLSTGDFGYLDRNKNLYLTGRKGNEQLHQGVQHYQLEHVLQHQPGILQAAAIATATGFDIYLEGTAKEADIREALRQYFPVPVIKGIYFREHLPVDSRHHSKILYAKIT